MRSREAAGAPSSYYYALAHQLPTRAHLRPKVIFTRTPNGCGHRQVACACAPKEGARIADKTVLKMMREMEHCAAAYRLPRYQLTRERGAKLRQHHRPKADGLSTGYGCLEFTLSFGKAYLAPVYDFASKEIVAHSISSTPTSPNNKRCSDAHGCQAPRSQADLALRHGMASTNTDLHQGNSPTTALSRACRKGNCIDNLAPFEQVS